MKKILLAEYQPHVISALRLMMDQEKDLFLCDEVIGISDILDKVKEISPDILLINWELPGLKPHFIIPRLTFLFPSLIIIAISGRPEVKGEAQAMGVHLFLHRWERFEDLLEKLHHVSFFREV